MAALDRLFDDARPPARALTETDRGHRSGGTTKSAGLTSRPVSVSALPLLPDRPVEADEHRPHRYLALNELDGPDYDDAVAGADRGAVEREVALYGRTEDVRLGWSKDAA